MIFVSTLSVQSLRFLLVSGILAHAIINKERGEAIVFNVKGEKNVCRIVFPISPSAKRIPKWRVK